LKRFLNQLSFLLTSDEKKSLVTIFFLSIFISILEIAGIGVIMPFISIASDFMLIHTNEYYALVYKLFDFQNDISFVITVGVILILFYIFRSMMSLFYAFHLSKYIRGLYFNIANRLFNNYLDRGYRAYLDKNSSELTKSLVNEVHGVTVIMSSSLAILTETLIVLFIYGFLMIMNYKVTILLTLMLGISIVLLKFFISNKIKLEGINREMSQRFFYEVINSTLANFKPIKLKANNISISKNFSNANTEFTRSQISYDILTNFPKLFLEALSFSIVILIIIYLIFDSEKNLSSFMGLITIFVLGLYRLMPSVNKLFTAYNNILYHYKSLDIIYKDMNCEVETLGNQNIEYQESICIQNIYFSYVKNKNIIKNITLSIKKGEKIAFIGESGSGKSTLVDIIMGLYQPNLGIIKVDDIEITSLNMKSWRKKIGYIPQDIYLFDGNVAQNVAFGNDIDEEKVKDSLQKANILKFLEDHHDGINTAVGEGGLKLSGGQKQRIAIARALYDNPEVLVLDEATSALDSDTEAKVMEEIYKLSLDKTLIVIAHRLTTVENCDKIFTLKHGMIIDIFNKGNK